MYADISKPPDALPFPELKVLQPGLSLLAPLSRLGKGPGLILLTTPDSTDESVTISEKAPSPLLKWAEEGYTVIQIPEKVLDVMSMSDALAQALVALERCPQLQLGKIGLISYSASLWNKAAPVLEYFKSIVASVIYIDDEDLDTLAYCGSPVLSHIAGKARTLPSSVESSSFVKYRYQDVNSRRFVSPAHEHFHYNTESVSHTRNLDFLKPHMGGPYFDLERIWDEHTHYEFTDRSVEYTMSTMVQEPYVNHVPTLTGGIGRDRLADFYRHNFIFNNSADTELELISRTIGIDKVIDEFIFKFTHDREIDWMLPGVPPTYRKIQVPFTAIVNIRGDRLYHEHIMWDQGTTLRQLGLLPEYLPFPYPLPGGSIASEGSSLEYRVPVAGLDTANKLRDRNSVESNEMLKFSVREKKD